VSRGKWACLYGVSDTVVRVVGVEDRWMGMTGHESKSIEFMRSGLINGEWGENESDGSRL